MVVDYEPYIYIISISLLFVFVISWVVTSSLEIGVYDRYLYRWIYKTTGNFEGCSCAYSCLMAAKSSVAQI